MDMEEGGNAYTCLGTHVQEFTRKRTHKGRRDSNKRAGGFIEICMYIWMQTQVYEMWEGGEK